MKISNLLKFLLAPFMMFAVDGEGGGTGGGTADRGDDFVPTDDDDAPTTTDPKAAGHDDDDIDPDNPDADKTKEKVETEDEADTKAKRKDTRIPLDRHKALLEKERAARATLEQEVAQLKQGKQVADTNEQLTEAENKVLGLEKEYTKLLVDGEIDKATAKMAEIRRLERGIAETKSTFQIQAAEARAYARVQYDTTVERLESAYPALNPDHEDYDAERTAEVVELRDGYIATGKYTRAQAIQKAAKTLMGASTTRQERAVTTEARVDKEDVAKKVADERAAAQRKKNADVANKQPSNINKAGIDSDKMGGRLDAKAVMKMDQDAFAKLDDATLARLRGDVIA